MQTLQCAIVLFNQQQDLLLVLGHGVIFLAKYWAMGEEEHSAVVAGGACGRHWGSTR